MYNTSAFVVLSIGDAVQGWNSVVVLLVVVHRTTHADGKWGSFACITMCKFKSGCIVHGSFLGDHICGHIILNMAKYNRG